MTFLTIQQGLRRVSDAQAALGIAMARRFPIDSRVGFTIQEGQINYSWGVVTGIDKDGYLTIETEMRKKRYMRVYYDSIHRVIKP